MINSLATREIRTIVAGVGCILGILSLARLIPWWRSTLIEERHAARETRADLLSATSRIQRLAILRDSVRMLGAQYLMSRARVLPGGTAAAAGAELASLLDAVAAEAGVDLGVVQPLGDSLRAPPFEGVMVRTELTGDVRGIMQMLRLIEGDTVLLAVHSLELTQPEPAADDRSPERLRGELKLQGLFRPSSWR